MQAREPQDDLEARKMRASVEEALFGNRPDPIKIDRYVILERLGSGGVGMVYAAYDPELDRRVALKLLRPQSGFGSSSSADARTRLRREAQAMAQLSHPNVITVYDVGDVGDEVYISMELVDGEDLAQWNKRGPHPWREVVGRFLQAARGLAAAHHVGLVHRDFKPSNVLAGADGRARVLDFGLAKLAEAAPEPELVEASDTTLRDVNITLTGSILGTPAYMAPEQHRNANVDARSDQYSFCVALYEALYGRRPFPGNDPKTLGAEKLKGEVALPDASPAGRVPAHLRRAIARGLAPDPEDRYPSMDVIVELLQHDPVARRRRWLGIGGVVGLGAIAVVAWSWGPAQDGPRCEDTVARLEGAWDAPTRERVRAAFERSGLTYATATLVRVEDAIDDYADAWVRARTAVCEATKTAGADSSQLAARQICLDNRLRDLAQLTQLLADADATVVENAVEATRTLPDLEVCDHATEAADSDVPPEQLSALELQLTRAQTLRAAGKYEESRDVAERLREDASTVGASAVERQTILLLGRLADDVGDVANAEKTLLEAIAAADRAGDDPVAIEALLELVFVEGVTLGRPEEGLRWARIARARIERAGTQTNEAQLLNHMGILLKDTGEHERAAEVLRQAIDLRTALGDQASVASSINNLGIVELERKNLDAACELFERAYEITVAERGADHPDVTSPLGNLATAYLELKKYDEAEEKLERTKQLQIATFGPEHPRIAITDQALGSLYEQRGELERALTQYERVIEISEKMLGPDHPLSGTAHANAGDVAAKLGRPELARQHLSQALERLVSNWGEDDPRLKELREQLAALPARSGAERGTP
jgi:tetratricopeptide (TPR) repeat protein